MGIRAKSKKRKIINMPSVKFSEVKNFKKYERKITKGTLKNYIRKEEILTCPSFWSSKPLSMKLKGSIEKWWIIGI